MQINTFKEFKEYVGNDGIGFCFFAIINIIVFNFRIEDPTILKRILFSFFTLVTYIIALIVVVNFISKEFIIIHRMTEDKNENYIEKRWPFGTLVTEDFGTKKEIIEKLTIKLTQYATIGFLIIDLVSIFFYRSSVILEILAFLIGYVLGQADIAG
jgi:hypothetical protein